METLIVTGLKTKNQIKNYNLSTVTPVKGKSFQNCKNMPSSKTQSMAEQSLGCTFSHSNSETCK